MYLKYSIIHKFLPIRTIWWTWRPYPHKVIVLKLILDRLSPNTVNRLINATFVFHHVNPLQIFPSAHCWMLNDIGIFRNGVNNPFPTVFLLLNVQYTTRSTFFQCALQKVALSMAHQKQNELGNLKATSVQGFSPHTMRGRKREINVYYMAH